MQPLLCNFMVQTIKTFRSVSCRETVVGEVEYVFLVNVKMLTHLQSLFLLLDSISDTVLIKTILLLLLHL